MVIDVSVVVCLHAQKLKASGLETSPRQTVNNPWCGQTPIDPIIIIRPAIVIMDIARFLGLQAR